MLIDCLYTCLCASLTCAVCSTHLILNNLSLCCNFLVEASLTARICPWGSEGSESHHFEETHLLFRILMPCLKFLALFCSCLPAHALFSDATDDSASIYDVLSDDSPMVFPSGLAADLNLSSTEDLSLLLMTALPWKEITGENRVGG